MNRFAAGEYLVPQNLGFAVRNQKHRCAVTFRVDRGADLPENNALIVELCAAADSAAVLAKLVAQLRSGSPVCCLAVAGDPQLRAIVEQVEQLLGLPETDAKPRKRRKS